MNFLAPLFLLGAAAVALPVVFHLIRRSVKEKTMFSSLMFLQPSPPRLTRRSRLENLLLLALRCAALCLLAAGFARPFLKRAFPQTQSAGPAKRMVVLLDASASMHRQGLWTAARDKAEALARAAGPADAAAFYTFGDRLRPLVGFEEWAAAAPGDRPGLARQRLAGLEPGWSGTALDTALVEAAELIGNPAKEDFGRREIVVISDFQEGARLAALQGHQWPRGVEVIAERVVARAGSNAGIQLVTEAADTAPVGPSVVRVRVSNASDSKREQFQAGWADREGKYIGKPVDVYVPAGQNRIVPVPNPPTNILAEQIVLRGDDEPFDNTLFVLPPERSQTSVLYLGNDAAADNRQPLFFLKRALQDTRRQTVKVVNQVPSAPLDPARASGAGLIVVTSAIDDQLAGALRQALLQGGSVLFAPTASGAAAGLGALLGTAPVQAQENKLDGYAMWAELDFTHPLFAPFADPRFSDFTKIHFWSYRKIDAGAVPNARIVARFDTGDPAIVDAPVGKGHLIVFASGWHPADSQLALSSKFVPLVYALLELGGTVAASPQQYFAGSSLPVPAAASLQTPAGEKLTLGATETSFAARGPGIYTVQSGPEQKRLAVNLEPAESRTGPLPNDELERLGVPGPSTYAAAALDKDRRLRLQNTELEARQKLWRWLLVACVAVLVLETWLAGWTARRASAREEIA